MPDKNVKSGVSEEVNGEFPGKTVGAVHNPWVGKARDATGSPDDRETVRDEMDAQSRRMDALLRRMDVQSKQMDALCKQVAAVSVQDGQPSREARCDRRVRLDAGDPRRECTFEPSCVCRDCVRSVGSSRRSTLSRSSRSKGRSESSLAGRHIPGSGMASLASMLLGMGRPVSPVDVKRRRSGKVVVREGQKGRY